MKNIQISLKNNHKHNRGMNDFGRETVSLKEVVSKVGEINKGDYLIVNGMTACVVDVWSPTDFLQLAF